MKKEKVKKDSALKVESNGKSSRKREITDLEKMEINQERERSAAICMACKAIAFTLLLLLAVCIVCLPLALALKAIRFEYIPSDIALPFFAFFLAIASVAAAIIWAGIYVSISIRWRK